MSLQSSSQNNQPGAFPVVEYLPNGAPVLVETDQAVLDQIVDHVLSLSGEPHEPAKDGSPATKTMHSNKPTLTANPYRALLNPQPQQTPSNSRLPRSYESFWNSYGGDPAQQCQSYPCSNSYATPVVQYLLPSGGQGIMTSQADKENWANEGSYTFAQQYVSGPRLI